MKKTMTTMLLLPALLMGMLTGCGGEKTAPVHTTEPVVSAGVEQTEPTTTAPEPMKLQIYLNGLTLELDKDFRLMHETYSGKRLSNGTVELSVEYSNIYYAQPPTLQELIDNNLHLWNPKQDRYETIKHKELDCLVLEYGMGGMDVYAYYFWGDHAWTVCATGENREQLLELATGGIIHPEVILDDYKTNPPA